MDPSTTLSLTVTLAVLAAAVTHAVWNAIAHGIKDQTLAFALIGVGGIVIAIPLVIVTGMPRANCWPYLLGSVAIHVFYNLLLMRCYRLGEFGQVYPLARGTSPLVVTILAAIFVHEHLALPQIAGVVIISAGLAVLVLAGRRPRLAGGREGVAPAGKNRAAFLAAVGTGLTIAAYTTVDGVGVRLSASPVGYIGWLMVLESLCVPMFALVRRRDVVAKQPRRILLAGLAAGALSVLAYGLVLWAQTRGALAQVGGVIVVCAGLAVLVLAGRRPGRAAFVAAVGTGLTIAAYTTVDGVGVRLSASPVGYIGWLMLLESLGVPMFALIRRRDVLLKQPRRILLAGLTAGALSVLAYGLVLWAQTRGALAPIAALRETSVIFGAIIGTLVFREPFGRTRIAATVVVVAGIVMLTVS